MSSHIRTEHKTVGGEVKITHKGGRGVAQGAGKQSVPDVLNDVQCYFTRDEWRSGILGEVSEIK